MGFGKYEQLQERMYSLLEEGNYNQALSELNKKNLDGDSDAMCILGHFYRYGTAVEQNMDKAIQLYENALERGNSIGAQILGILFEFGDENTSILPNAERAFRYYKKAAELGNTDALGSLASCYYYGTGTNEDDVLAFSYATNAAKQGILRGKVITALCYDFGFGTKRDPFSAAYWYREVLMEDEEPEFMCRLSICLASPYNAFNIVTTSEMLEEAYFWASKAVEHGHVESHVVIAWFYETGNYVQKDLEVAHKYLTLAANFDSELARDLLKRYRKNIRGLIYLPD